MQIIKPFLLMIAVSSPLSATPFNPGTEAREDSTDGPSEETNQDLATREAFTDLVLQWNKDPAFAGSKVGIRIGNNWAIIDRLAAPKPAQPGPNALDKILATVEKSSSAKASLHVQYYHEWIDENGKPQKEQLILDAGVASGAAAAAQKSMDEAMGKNHQ